MVHTVFGDVNDMILETIAVRRKAPVVLGSRFLDEFQNKEWADTKLI